MSLRSTNICSFMLSVSNAMQPAIADEVNLPLWDPLPTSAWIEMTVWLHRDLKRLSKVGEHRSDPPNKDTRCAE